MSWDHWAAKEPRFPAWRRGRSTWLQVFLQSHPSVSVTILSRSLGKGRFCLCFLLVLLLLLLLLLPSSSPPCPSPSLPFFFHCFLFLIFLFLLFLSSSFWLYFLVVIGIFITHSEIIWLPWWLSGKEPTNARDVGLIPGEERSPGEGNGNPLHYPYLGNSMDRRAWWHSKLKTLKEIYPGHNNLKEIRKITIGIIGDKCLKFKKKESWSQNIQK